MQRYRFVRVRRLLLLVAMAGIGALLSNRSNVQAQVVSRGGSSSVVVAEEMANIADDANAADGIVRTSFQNTNAPPTPPTSSVPAPMPLPNRPQTPAPRPQPNAIPPQPPVTPPTPNNSANNQPTYNSLAGSPYMIGDTPVGDRMGFQLGEVLTTNTQFPPNTAVRVANIRGVAPSLAAGRLNIAENESPLVRDRVIFNYRYFAQATEFLVNDFTARSLHRISDIHRFTVGFERRLSDDFSYQVRVPLNIQQGSSTIYTQINNPGELSGRAGELGNIGLIFKKALIQANDLYVSSGFGVNLPTGPDANFTAIVNDTTYQTAPNVAPLPANFTLNSRIRNQSVSMLPYLGGVWRPDDFRFSQAFLQFDVPLNSSQASLDAVGAVNANTMPISERIAGRIVPQTLMRLNLGTGFWLYRDDFSRLIHSAGLMFEAHYTTTTTNATIVNSRGNVAGDRLTQIGNFANRLDVMNFVLAAPMVIGRTQLTNAFAAPITQADDRGFNLEYSLQINRVY